MNIASLEAEIQHRKQNGCEQVTVKEMGLRFAALGYRLDRTMDCRSISRYLVSGRTYPACSTGLNEAATGRSAFHFESRRDANYRAMQTLRQNVFAVSRGAILEV